MDGKNDVQTSISMIVKTKDICPDILESAQKIPEICPKDPRNLSRTSLKSAQNVLETVVSSKFMSPKRLGDSGL
jgi:hypothetical protein